VATNAGVSEFGGTGRAEDDTYSLDEATRSHRAIVQTDPNSLDAPGQTPIANQKRNERT
jgi:hypothetical protein